MNDLWLPLSCISLLVGLIALVACMIPFPPFRTRRCALKTLSGALIAFTAVAISLGPVQIKPGAAPAAAVEPALR